MSDVGRLVPGIADRDAEVHPADCGCGCHDGAPRQIANRAGVSEVAYRPGRYADFHAAQIARLSSSRFPSLERLRSRETDDFSLALIDAWSCVCEVVSFYQERNANEFWLGTATERGSLIELGRLIGYQLDAGVAAGVDLVFQLDRPPGVAGNAVRGQAEAPMLVVEAVRVPARSRVQSIPGPGEVAQTFETQDDLEARVEWNALAVRQARLVLPRNRDAGIWLEGISTGLGVGDAIVIVGEEKLDDPGSERWDFRKLTSVTTDAHANRTWVTFTHRLGSISPPSGVARVGVRVYAFRARAALFGANAPHPNLFTRETRLAYGLTPGEDWSFVLDKDNVYLDSVQQGWLSGSFVALARPVNNRNQPYVELYRLLRSDDDGRTAYSVSGRATRLGLDGEENLKEEFAPVYRSVSVYGRSEELTLAETPIRTPIEGDRVELDGLAADLPIGRRLIVRGRRPQALVAAEELVLSDGRRLANGSRVTLLATRVPASNSEDFLCLLRDAGGTEASVRVRPNGLAFVEAEPGTEIVAEQVVLHAVDHDDLTHDVLVLKSGLANAFDRATTVVHANVAAATHGETTEEILGDGNAGRPFQAFRLKQAPLTYISAGTETGSLSSLEIRVDDLLWTEVPSLFGHGPSERVYETRMTGDGATIVQFGGGAAGARPSTGRNNIVARYRKGTGQAGSVRAETLTTLLDRPLGLRDAFNPVAASGGDDPETLHEARGKAPVTTLTLGRVVSLRNYEDFARGFAGISKAKADWAWDGESRSIVITVAGVDGSAVDPGTGDLHENLSRALRSLGDPFVRINLISYRPAGFKLAMRVKVMAGHVSDTVLAALETALRAAYGFEQGSFARLVVASATVATAHSVAGVEAVDLDLLHRTTPPNAQVMLHQRLAAEPAGLATNGQLQPAEILILDPGPIDLRVMT